MTDLILPGPFDQGEPFDPQGALPRLKAGDPKVRILRQSNIGSADICLKRAAYDMRPDNPRHSGEARCVGTAYHAGMEHYYRARQAGHPTPRKGCIDAAMVAFQKEADLFDTWATSRDEAWQRTIDMVDAYFNGDRQWPDNFEVLGVEWEFFVYLFTDANGVEWFLKGSVDLVLRGPQGEVHLDDHKTAGKKWPLTKHQARKQTQAVIYCWAWWRATGEVPASFNFDIMTYKHDFDRRSLVVRPEHMQAVLEKAMAYSGILSLPPEMLPGNPTSNLCSGIYCDYWAECPFGLQMEQLEATA